MGEGLKEKGVRVMGYERVRNGGWVGLVRGMCEVGGGMGGEMGGELVEKGKGGKGILLGGVGGVGGGKVRMMGGGVGEEEMGREVLWCYYEWFGGGL